MNWELALYLPLPSLKELMEQGGALMIPIAALNAGVWVILLERLLFWVLALPQLSREKRLLGRYLKETSGKPLGQFLREEAPRRADRLLTDGWFVRPVHVLQVKGEGAWEDEADASVARSERYVSLLTLFATLATSFGLLGTVVGVAGSLQYIETDFSKLVQGLSVALYTTVLGIVVSIQAILSYAVFQTFSNSLSNRISGWIRELRLKPAAAKGA
ncbi:MAG: MotA/TolQ/ExbB proton channel family protein [Planctomycetes bacterium]|jgi:biopolymer transport protein ExbB/TolQ|nr:MotA/TolQ/ExbB proton channel family protein [Planctomycetota bacterium]